MLTEWKCRHADRTVNAGPSLPTPVMQCHDMTILTWYQAIARWHCFAATVPVPGILLWGRCPRRLIAAPSSTCFPRKTRSDRNRASKVIEWQKGIQFSSNYLTRMSSIDANRDAIFDRWSRRWESQGIYFFDSVSRTQMCLISFVEFFLTVSVWWENTNEWISSRTIGNGRQLQTLQTWEETV